MNLTITPNFQIFSNQQPKNSHNNIVMPSKLSVLKADTVSFGSVHSKAESVFGKAVENSYLSQMGKFIDSAKDFHRALKRACAKLADDGFVYDDAYNSKHPIKSKNSYIDKFERQGYVQDTVRGTVYWLDQQNIPAFKKFIDTMKEEGYEIAVIKNYNPETGKFVKLPDLEIRQNGITKEDLEPLGSFLSKSEISKPRSSTYSDYQMRFVSIKKLGKNKQPLELIMLYGPHYSKAKEAESKYVYNIARQLDKLHIDLKKKYAEKSPGRRIANNIDVIKTRLREDVSKPLFVNAYIADAKLRGEEKLPVVISKVHAEMLDGYMSGIRQKIPLYYKEAKQKFKSDEFITDLIKRSSEYQERENKIITPEEIKERKLFYKDRLDIMEAEDISTVAKAQEMLKATLGKYAEKTAAEDTKAVKDLLSE